MKLHINKVALLGNNSVAVMEHNGVEIQWNIALFEKTSLSGEFDIFEQINSYWAGLNRSVQDEIFATYTKIKDVFDSVYDADELTTKLYSLVKDLYVHHELDHVRHWVDFRSNIIIPDTLPEAFKETYDNSSTRERTYTKEDYRWLLALSVALRAMIPIWGEFIYRTKDETGTVFKEYYAFKLLAYSSVARSEPMERLRVYVERSLPADKSKAAAILGGISSEDFPTWILGLVVVRRLTVGDVRGIDPNTSLVTFIYKYISQKVKGHDGQFIGLVKDKIIDGQAQEGENNLSKLEGYKIKQEIPAGDIAIMGFWMRDTLGIAQKLAPDIPLEMVTMSQESVQALETEQIWDPQICLMQWILKPAGMPPRGLMHLNKKSILDAIAICQAVLWHKKHYELAALLSAMALPNKEELQLGGASSRARLPKEMVETLGQLYPFARPIGGKAKLNKIPPNPGHVAVESMEKMFSEHEWRLTLPGEWVAVLTGNKNNRRYSVPHDIKIKLATLVIAIAQRSF